MLPTPWIAYHHSLPNARLRLLCFHHAGGGASAFRSWAELLQPYRIELCAVQLPGRETRFSEEPYSDLPLLTDQLATALEPYTDLPFALLGHSMGGLIAFCVAQRIQPWAHNLQHLIISAITPPWVEHGRAPIHHLPDDEFVTEVMRFNGLPNEVVEDREMMELLMPALRADFALSEQASVPAAPLLDCPLSVYAGINDQSNKSEEIEMWCQRTLGPFRMRKFAGDHFYLFKHETMVIRTIVQDLFAANL